MQNKLKVLRAERNWSQDCAHLPFTYRGNLPVRSRVGRQESIGKQFVLMQEDFVQQCGLLWRKCTFMTLHDAFMTLS